MNEEIEVYINENGIACVPLKMYNDSLEEIQRLNKECDTYMKISTQKQKRIDKAIEYIQDRYDGEALTHTFDKDNVKELLKILQGSDKE